MPEDEKQKDEQGEPVYQRIGPPDLPEPPPSLPEAPPTRRPADWPPLPFGLPPATPQIEVKLEPSPGAGSDGEPRATIPFERVGPRPMRPRMADLEVGRFLDDAVKDGRWIVVVCSVRKQTDGRLMLPCFWKTCEFPWVDMPTFAVDVARKLAEQEDMPEPTRRQLTMIATAGRAILSEVSREGSPAKRRSDRDTTWAKSPEILADIAKTWARLEDVPPVASQRLFQTADYARTSEGLKIQGQ